MTSHRPFLRTLILPALLTLGALTLSCGSDPVRGRVVVSGSSTLSPLVSLAVTKWRSLHPKVETRVEAIGSDAGLERLLRYSDADLALVSRPLTDADRQAAAAAGKTLVVLPVAWDAVCLVVPASNTWARTLTRDQAVLAFTTARLWSDLDPDWPAVPLHRFVLGPRSGTADVLAATLLGGRKQDLYSAPEVQATEDDRILARGIAQVEGALGFLGWTTLRESGGGLRALALDGVLPEEKSLLDHSYGMTRSLWLAATREGLETNPAAGLLIRYFYENYTALTADSGLVPLSDTERTQALWLLENR